MNSVAVPPNNYPREGGAPVSQAALQPEGPADFWPALCLKTHWDPTAILRRTLPTGYAPQPLDPRPWTRICMEYTNSSPEEPAPCKVGSNSMKLVAKATLMSIQLSSKNFTSQTFMQGFVRCAF